MYKLERSTDLKIYCTIIIDTVKYAKCILATIINFIHFIVHAIIML